MAFIPAPETVQLQVTATKDSLPVENVFNFQKDGGWTEALMLSLLQFSLDYWEVNAPALLPSDLTLNQMIATDISQPIGIQREANFTAGTVGTLGGEPMPSNVSKLCTLSTGLRGRSARGGIHWMGLSEAVVASNTIASSMLTAIDNFLTGFITEIKNEVSADMVVVSRQFQNVPRETAALFVITGVTFANARVGSMRGRLT